MRISLSQDVFAEETTICLLAETDSDGDGIPDNEDNCLNSHNPGQKNFIRLKVVIIVAMPVNVKETLMVMIMWTEQTLQYSNQTLAEADTTTPAQLVLFPAMVTFYVTEM